MNNISAIVQLTAEQLKERSELKDAIHAQHNLTFQALLKHFKSDEHLYQDAQSRDAYERCVNKALAALSYFEELLPSKGFWGRACARLTAENRDLKKQIEELKEYKWKYEDLCK